MKIETNISVWDIDKFGKPFCEVSRKSNSLLSNFFAILAGRFLGGVTTYFDTGGTARNLTTSTAYQWNTFAANCAANSDTFGIQVGTGTNPVLPMDYSLQTKIAHGGGGGQLAYAVMQFDSAGQVSGNKGYFRLWRAFTNNSGGDITVQEVGLVVKAYYDSTLGYALIDRSLFELLIANGATKTITFELSFTVS